MVDYAVLYQDRGPFVRALHSGEETIPVDGLTGLTVPHHLLAADMIVRALSLVPQGDVSLFIIISPDHFRRASTPAATTSRSFLTCMGRVEARAPLAQALMSPGFIEESNLFSHEHGVRALLPFLAAMHPSVPVLPLALSTDMGRETADMIVERLADVLKKEGVWEKTVVLQSSDFSHFLTPEESLDRDRETLAVLSSGDPGGVWNLTQPFHTDSLAGLYIQWRLQEMVYGSSLRVLSNRNADLYGADGREPDTSYLTLAFSDSSAWPQEHLVPGTSRWFFGGDVFTGRYLAHDMARPGFRAAVGEAVQAVTMGAPMVVNLEGVLAEDCANEDRMTLCMEREPALDLLKRLNVRVAGLANNHAMDMGRDAMLETRQTLERTMMRAPGSCEAVDTGPFVLLGLSDVDNSRVPMQGLLDRESVRECVESVRREDKPLVAFVHWGREYAAGPGGHEKMVVRVLEDSGAALIVGAHPHTASPLSCGARWCVQYSLGNLLFDQAGPRVSSALLEAVFLERGTVWARRHDLGNLHQELE